ISCWTRRQTSGPRDCRPAAGPPDDSNYNAATQATQSTTAVKANQTITVSTPAPATAVYNTSFTVAATASSSLAVSYSSSGVCSRSEERRVGRECRWVCAVELEQARDSNYNAATEI